MNWSKSAPSIFNCIDSIELVSTGFGMNLKPFHIRMNRNPPFMACFNRAPRLLRHSMRWPFLVVEPIAVSNCAFRLWPKSVPPFRFLFGLTEQFDGLNDLVFDLHHVHPAMADF